MHILVKANMTELSRQKNTQNGHLLRKTAFLFHRGFLQRRAIFVNFSDHQNSTALQEFLC